MTPRLGYMEPRKRHKIYRSLLEQLKKRLAPAKLWNAHQENQIYLRQGNQYQ